MGHGDSGFIKGDCVPRVTKLTDRKERTVCDVGEDSRFASSYG